MITSVSEYLIINVKLRKRVWVDLSEYRLSYHYPGCRDPLACAKTQMYFWRLIFLVGLSRSQMTMYFPFCDINEIRREMGGASYIEYIWVVKPSSLLIPDIHGKHNSQLKLKLRSQLPKSRILKDNPWP